MAIIMKSGDTEKIFEKGETRSETLENVVNEKSETSEVNEELENDESDNSLSYLDGEENNQTDLDDSDLDNEEDDDELDDHNSEEVKEYTPKKNKGIQKRINKITKEKAMLKEQLELLAKQVEELKSSKNTENQKFNNEESFNDLKKPNIDDFEDYDEYQLALSEYTFNKKFQEVNRKNQLEQEEKRKSEYQEKIAARYKQNLVEAVKKIGEENWKKNAKSLDFDEQLSTEIVESELGPHIYYYLCVNKNEADNLKNLSYREQVKKIALIEEKIRSKLTTKKTSNAPAPIKPITTGVVVKQGKYSSYKEYKKLRNKDTK